MLYGSSITDEEEQKEKSMEQNSPISTAPPGRSTLPSDIYQGSDDLEARDNDHLFAVDDSPYLPTSSRHPLDLTRTYPSAW